MQTKINKTILAYLLALSDYCQPLSQPEQRTLKAVAQVLETQPEAWDNYTEPLLFKTIQANSQLNQSFQFYQAKLEDLTEIPLELLSGAGDIDQLNFNESSLVSRGGFPMPATGYEQQLNNVVIVVGQSENPLETVKNMGFLEKMKQYLTQNSQ